MSNPPGFGCLLFCFLCCYRIESAIDRKPKATSKPRQRYFWLAEIVTTEASLCLRDAAAGNRNKYSTDLWRGYHSVNGRGSKSKRLQRELLLLGTVTVLLTPKSESNTPHTELVEFNIWLAAAVTLEVDCHENGG